MALFWSLRWLDLQCGMVDAETALELSGDVAQEGRVGRRPFHDEMGGKSDLRCAHRPNMQVVYLAYPLEAREEGKHLLGVDVLWHGVERRIERLAQQAPGATDDGNRDGETDRWVEPSPSFVENEYPSHDHAHAHQGIGREVEKCGLEVCVTLQPDAKSRGEPALANQDSADRSFSPLPSY